MSKPEVSLENYQALYGNYAEQEPSEFAQKSLHFVSSLIYRTNIDSAPLAEVQLQELIDRKTRILMASNHINMFDQFPLAAAMQERSAFDKIRGHVSTPAKPWFFNNPIRRALFEMLGGQPVFRRHEEGKDADNGLLEAATESYYNLCVNKLVDEEEIHHMLWFPEGTRNKKNSSTNTAEEIGRIKKGIGVVASRASRQVPVAILPIGLWHGDKWRHPSVYIGNPLQGPFETHEDVIKPLSTTLSHCVAEAIALSQQ